MPKQLVLPFVVEEPKQVYKTARIKFSTTLKKIKVVDKYNQCLAEADVDHIPVSRGTNGRSKIVGKKNTICVINTPFKRDQYYRYINDEAELQTWITRVNDIAK